MSFFEKILKILNEYGLTFLEGIGITLFLAIVGTALGLIISFFLVLLRIINVKSRDTSGVKILKYIGIYFSKAYIQVFRGTPMIVQAMIFYYGASLVGMPMKPLVAGLVTVTLNTAAYLAEVLRAGISSVDPGQKEAARSLGFSEWKTFSLVILPQGLKNSLPSIGNEIIVNIKDTSVLNVIQVMELFFVANSARSRFASYFEAMILVASIYLCLTLLTSFLLRLLEKRLGLPAKELPSSN